MPLAIFFRRTSGSLVRSHRWISVDSGFISFSNLAVLEGLQNSFAVERIQICAWVFSAGILLQMQVFTGRPQALQLGYERVIG